MRRIKAAAPMGSHMALHEFIPEYVAGMPNCMYHLALRSIELLSLPEIHQDSPQRLPGSSPKDFLI